MTADHEAFILKQATLRARLLSLRAGFSPDEIADARQDLLLDILRRAPKYDGARGAFEGFVCGVMRNHAAVLAIRRYRRDSHEIPQDVWDESSDTKDKSARSLDARCHPDMEAGLQTRIDVQRVLNQLPPQLLKLALLLSEVSVLEACARVGRSRSCVFQMTRQLREAFIGAGFRSRSETRPRSKAASPGGVQRNGRP